MNKAIEWLDGKKSYLQAAAAAVIIGLHLAGLLSQELLVAGLGLLGAGSVASLRAAIGKGE